MLNKVLLIVFILLLIMSIFTLCSNNVEINNHINTLQYEVNDLWSSVYSLDEQYTTIITHMNNKEDI